MTVVELIGCACRRQYLSMYVDHVKVGIEERVGSVVGIR